MTAASSCSAAGCASTQCGRSRVSCLPLPYRAAGGQQWVWSRRFADSISPGGPQAGLDMTDRTTHSQRWLSPRTHMLPFLEGLQWGAGRSCGKGEQGED